MKRTAFISLFFLFCAGNVTAQVHRFLARRCGYQATPVARKLKSIVPQGELSIKVMITPGDDCRYYLVQWETSRSVDYALKYLDSTGIFDYVEYDSKGNTASVCADELTDDSFFKRQWYLDNDGSFSMVASVADADIDIPEAWVITQGSSDVVVAILDTGVKPDHVEFEGRLWKNEKEIPDNNIDDDKNGYTDDVQGWNWVADSKNIGDDAGHGTHVAGIIGANGNNHYGYAGVDWYCRLMILKVLDSEQSGYYSDWIEAIHYAVDHGARIINMSMGGKDYSKALEEAIGYARKKNVLVVASMQNYNSDVPYFPAAYTPVLAVGATDPNDHRSKSFSGTQYGSSYGAHIDVVAPGNYIYGLSHVAGNDEGIFLSGTSQAAPVVSGIAALLLSRHELTNVELESCILKSAEDGVGDADDIPGWDKFYGYGRVNANNALRGLFTAGDSYDALSVYPDPASDHITISKDQGIEMEARLSITDAAGRLVYRKYISWTRIISFEIPVKEFANGLYVVIFENEKERQRIRWLKMD